MKKMIVLALLLNVLFFAKAQDVMKKLIQNLNMTRVSKSKSFFSIAFVFTFHFLLMGQEEVQDQLSFTFLETDKHMKSTYVMPPEKDSIHVSDTIHYNAISDCFAWGDDILTEEIYFRLVNKSDIGFTIEQVDKNGEIIYTNIFTADENTFGIVLTTAEKEKITIKDYIVKKEEDNLVFTTYSTMISAVTYDDISFKITVNPYFVKHQFTVIYNELGGCENSERYEINDYFSINNQFFKIASFNFQSKKGVINVINPDTPILNYGFRIGQTIKEIDSLKHYINDNKQEGASLGDKEYILIHNWFYGCKPCIDDFPKEIKLFNVIDSSKVDIVNWAYIFAPIGLDKTLNLIDKHNLPKINVIDEGILWKRKLGVYQYPSHILINKNGEIIYRDDHSCTTPKTISEKLYQLNLLKTKNKKTR